MYLRRIYATRNQMHAYPCVRLGKWSKDTAHICVDTSFLICAGCILHRYSIVKLINPFIGPFYTFYLTIGASELIKTSTNY